MPAWLGALAKLAVTSRKRLAARCLTPLRILLQVVLHEADAGLPFSIPISSHTQVSSLAREKIQQRKVHYFSWGLPLAPILGTPAIFPFSFCPQ